MIHPKPLVLVACQAGTSIGLGHLSRMLVAARALAAAGRVDVRLLIQGEPVQRPDLDAFAHGFVGRDADVLQAIDAALPADRPSAVLLDLAPAHRPAGLATALQRWGERGTVRIGIDGLLDLRGMLDWIFLPSFRLPDPAIDPTGSASHAAVRFGWDCLLLDAAPPTSAWQAPTPARVLALTGGSDATDLGTHWPALLDGQLPAGSTVDWVTGPYARHPVLPESAQARLHWREHLAPSGLEPLMRQASHAVTVFGVSCFELLRLGVPTVVFSPYGGRDDATLTELAAHGVAVVAANEREATAALATLIAHPEQAAELSRRAQAALARSGAQTLADGVLDRLGVLARG